MPLWPLAAFAPANETASAPEAAGHDARRPNSRQRGYTREWEALRTEFLRLHPTCAYCGCGAEVVDHIKRHHGDRVLVMNWNNLQALCKRCHDSEKQRQERAKVET